MKTNVLVVGDFNRSDFLFVAKQLYKEANFYFIEYLNEKSLQNTECLKYGEVLYWKDFNDAYELINKIRPVKVIFYFIESYNHVALNVACKVNNIPTYHLEHGLRFSLSYYKSINKSKLVQAKSISRFKRLSGITEVFDKYRNRRFFQHTARKSPSKERLFLAEYYNIRSKNGIFDTFQQLKSNLRLPDSYISFSPLIFNYHKELEDLPDNYPVEFIGIPQFDAFYKWEQVSVSGEHILFIDQPLHEQQLYGWSRAGKEFFLKTLAHQILLLKKKLYIKPHPLNDLELYNELLTSGDVKLVANDWEVVVTDINAVLGFSSTLLLPFMAMDHISCFTLEMHPEQMELPYSQFLLESGACNVIYSFEELALRLKEWRRWHIKQKEAKKSFIENYMYKFDGKSSVRLKNILLGEAS